MITLDQAKQLEYGQTLYHVTRRNADGTARRWRVTGKVKTWKRDASKVYVPLKHGMYGYDSLSASDFRRGVCYHLSQDDLTAPGNAWRVPFEAACRDQPDDDLPKLVYAGALEERGEDQEAAALRAVCSQLV
jgi:uncharacterized protein (TIGR02996 family)